MILNWAFLSCLSRMLQQLWFSQWQMRVKQLLISHANDTEMWSVVLTAWKCAVTEWKLSDHAFAGAGLEHEALYTPSIHSALYIMLILKSVFILSYLCNCYSHKYSSERFALQPENDGLGSQGVHWESSQEFEFPCDNTHANLSELVILSTFWIM